MRFLFLAILGAALAASCDRASETRAPAPVPEAQDAAPDPYRAWDSYGGAADFTRYSALDQINRENVHRLEVAWTFETGDAAKNTELQITPLLLNGRLYVASPQMRVYALDPATGEELWRFVPNVPDGPPARRRNRGFAAWSGGDEARIFIAIDHDLYALDAATGEPAAAFGNGGIVDLREGLGRDLERIEVGSNSPGAVFEDLLIMGSLVGEIYPAAPGDIRAYNVRTGEIVWTFHTIPHPGEFGYDTWPEDAWEYVGGANAWSGVSLDVRRGLAIVGTASPSYDFYGGNRPGANLFSDSIVALDARTGELVWHYQVIAHDLWDRDMPSAPTLATIEKDGAPLDVVIASTKQGYVYVLDRETGEPVHPMKELIVPKSTLPGETTPDVIRVPTKPAPIARTEFTPEMITKRTREAHDAVAERVAGMRYEGLFTPPSFEGTLFLPDYAGASTWGGGAFDPHTGLYYINAREHAAVVRMVEKPGLDAVASASELYAGQCAVCHGQNRAGAGDVPDITGLGLRQRFDPETLTAFISNGRGLMPGFGGVIADAALAALASYLLYGADDPIEIGAEGGGRERLPYVMDGFQYLHDPDGYPILEPPWGTMNAIDIATGEYVWKRPLGTYPELEDTMGETGTLNYGGPVVTGGGLVFIAATLFDNQIRAFHSETGEVLWEGELPTAGVATPAVYEAGGRQFVVIAAGGGKFRATPGGSYVAFALPEDAL